MRVDESELLPLNVFLEGKVIAMLIHDEAFALEDVTYGYINMIPVGESRITVDIEFLMSLH